MISLASSTGLRQRLLWLVGWFRGEWTAWLFVLKSLLAFYIAAWLAMRFALEQPATSMITVALVMHPHSGMVLAKSFYRAIGTLAGSLFGLLLMGMFAQERILFLLCLSLWVGLCAGGATLFRNFMSYGFVLAGYTAAIITLPTVNHPHSVFDSAVMRVSEVLLGIIVAGVISDTVLPARVRAMLQASVQSQFAQFMGFVRDSTSGKLAREDMQQAHLNFVRTAVHLEDLRSTVIFEDAEARARSGRMSLLNHYYMAASTSFQSVHHLINRIRRGGRNNVADALIALYRPLGLALVGETPERRGPARQAQRLGAARRALPALALRLRRACEDEEARLDFDTGASVLLRFTDELHQFSLLEASLRDKRVRGGVEKVSFKRGNDVAAAVVAVLRTALTMAALSAWWLISGWSYGSSAMLLAVIFCGLFATSPQPLPVVLNTWYGYALGMLVGGVVSLVILPVVDGYGLLIAASLPLLLLGSYLIAHPRSMLLGVGYTIGYVYIMALKNPMVYDPVRVFNDGLAQLIGLALTSVAFIFIPTVTGSAWQRRRQAIRLRRQVVAAARDPLRGLSARLESVNRDLLQQIVAHAPPDSPEVNNLLAWALSVNESGRGLIELRRQLRAHPYEPALHTAVQTVIHAVAMLYDAPSAPHWLAADEAVADAITLAIVAISHGQDHGRVLLTNLRLLRSALRDDESALAVYMTASDASTEVPHAT